MYYSCSIYYAGAVQAGQRSGAAAWKGVEARSGGAWKHCVEVDCSGVETVSEILRTADPAADGPDGVSAETETASQSPPRGKQAEMQPARFFFPPAISLTRRDDSADTQCQIQETNNEISGRFEIVKSMNKERKKERNK